MTRHYATVAHLHHPQLGHGNPPMLHTLLRAKRKAATEAAGERVTDLELASRLRRLVTHESLWSAGARHSDPEQLQLGLEGER